MANAMACPDSSTAAPVHADLPAIMPRKREPIDYFRADRVHEFEAFPSLMGEIFARIAQDLVA